MDRNDILKYKFVLRVLSNNYIQGAFEGLVLTRVCTYSSCWTTIRWLIEILSPNEMTVIYNGRQSVCERVLVLTQHFPKPRLLLLLLLLLMIGLWATGHELANMPKVRSFIYGTAGGYYWHKL